jgi:D-lyxose ketol-isomerase
MPSGEPLVLHFGLNDFQRIGEIEYWIVNDRENNYCGKFLFLFAEQRCPLHCHKIKDETFFIVRGTVAMEVDGQAMTLREGEAFKMAPGRQHTFAAQDGPALVLEVSLPSILGDNFFEDTRIGNGGVL